MGGALDWPALAVVCELQGAEPEPLLHQLLIIRDFQAARAAAA